MRQVHNELKFTLEDLSDQLGGVLHFSPTHSKDILIEGVSTLTSATGTQAAFLTNKKYAAALPETQAGVVLLTEADQPHCQTHALVLDNPEVGLAKLAQLFAPKLTHYKGVHPTAVVDPSADIASDVSIGPHAVIGAHVKIACKSIIGAGVVIAEHCTLGESVHLYPNVTLYHAVELGHRCIVHSGAVIGSDGFGLANDRGRWLKIPQLGRVHLEDDVEIGANTTIDRGALEDTVIGQGAKIDNLVQIAHNVKVGSHTAMAAQVGVAGSTQIGQHCMIGGATGITGHIKIGDQCHFTGMSMVTKSIAEPGVYSSGLPAKPTKVWHKTIARVNQLERLAGRMSQLEKQLKKLERST